MALKNGTLVRADDDLRRAVDYALTLRSDEEKNPGMRRRRSTVNDVSSGGSAALRHPFDAMIVNTGTDESPVWKVRIYNSALPDSPYAGVVSVYEYEYDVPVTDLAITSTDTGFFVVLDVTYVSGTGYSCALALYAYGSVPSPGYTTARTYIAQGKLPDIASEVAGNIIVTGRWV